MRRRTLIVSALLGATVIAVVVVASDPPPERPPLQYSDIFEPHPRSAPDPRRRHATLDTRRDCLVLADGRDFVCSEVEPPVRTYETERRHLIMMVVTSGHSDGTTAPEGRSDWVAECASAHTSELWLGRFPSDYYTERQAFEIVMRGVRNSEEQEAMDRLAEVVVESVDTCIEGLSGHRF